ncbi:MAG: hypothetical protein LN412_07905 [Candidatus Thermoplasmatota archaeon]|nr:hypothetical protein [Candidatus Thermoplasmatota archaeon]
MKTLTELAFMLAAGFGGLYAFMDWLFFRAGNESFAIAEIRTGLTALNLSVLFFFLFARWYVGRPKRQDMIFIIATALPIALIWTVLLEPGLNETSWNGFVVSYNQLWFSVWLGYIVGFMVGGIYLTYKASRIVAEQSRLLGRRVLGITVTLLIALFFGLATNTLFAFIGLADLPPFFSSLMLFPGILTVRALMPTAGTRISGAMLNWARRRFDLIDAFLIYENGTLIESRGRKGGSQSVDDDIFGATLDAIQSFMKTSFPYLVGKWLRTVEHGDVRIIIERGQFCYLALVIRGVESDFLRRQMIEALGNFEVKNRAAIADWNGVVDDLHGISDLLGTFFTERAVL